MSAPPRTSVHPLLARLLRALPALVWMGMIFYTSSQPALPIDGHPSSGEFHRVGHIVAYAVLALLVRCAVANLPAAGWLAFVLTALYGVSDEIHQSFVPNRAGTLRDVLLDSAAAAVALLLLARWRRTKSG